MGMTAGSL